MYVWQKEVLICLLVRALGLELKNNTHVLAHTSDTNAFATSKIVQITEHLKIFVWEYGRELKNDSWILPVQCTVYATKEQMNWMG